MRSVCGERRLCGELNSFCVITWHVCGELNGFCIITLPLCVHCVVRDIFHVIIGRRTPNGQSIESDSFLKLSSSNHPSLALPDRFGRGQLTGLI